MAKGNLNDPIIKNLEAPDKRTEIPDGNGLYLRVTEKGHKSFVYRYRYNDKIRRFTIGSYPAVSLGQARKRAEKLSVKVSEGDDPQAEKKAKKQKPDVVTVWDLAADFKRDYLPSKKASTQRSYTSRIGKITDKFGRISIHELTTAEIKRWLKTEAKKHPTNANRLQAIFSKMYSYAVKEGYTTDHPLKGVDKVGGKESQRELNYDHSDIRRLWEAFEQQEEPMQSLLKLLLLTGQRLGETSRMKWEHLQRDNGLWIIPQTETKGKETHLVPLSEKAIEVLENVHQVTGGTDYVFASPVKENEPLSHFNAVVKRIRETSELKGFKIHDLRHIVITGMISIGVDMVHVGKSVSHKGLAKEYAITNRYAHYEYLDEKRSALRRWSEHLQRILEGITEAKFFQIG